MKKPTSQQVNEAFQILSQAGYIMAGNWHTNDIKGYCEDNNIKLTAAQIKNVKNTLEKAFDATNGISWAVISDTITTLYPETL